MKSTHLKIYCLGKSTHYKGMGTGENEKEVSNYDTCNERNLMKLDVNILLLFPYRCRFRYFDACIDLHEKDVVPLDLGDGLNPIDFKVHRNRHNSKFNRFHFFFGSDSYAISEYLMFLLICSI